MQFWTLLYFSGRYFCMFYDHILWLIRPTMPLRHRRSALRLFGSYRWRGTKGAPWRRTSLGKITLLTRHPWLDITRQERIKCHCRAWHGNLWERTVICFVQKNPRRDFFRWPTRDWRGGAAVRESEWSRKAEPRKARNEGHGRSD